MYIITHTDLDGIMSGAVVYNYFKNIYDNIEVIFYNYENNFDFSMISDGDIVYITDLSLSKGNLNNIIAVKSLSARCDVTWIDHHASSIDIETFVLGLGSIKGIRNVNRSGAYLTYTYLHGTDSIPDIIKTTDDYDRFVHAIADSKAINAAVIYSDYSRNIKAPILSKLLIGDIDAYLNLVSKGRTILDIQERMNDRVRKNAFEADLNGVTVCALNAAGNSATFGELYNKYDYVSIFNVTKDGKFKYSVYSKLGTNGICNKIAEAYGGGGHPGAAGFQSDKLVFENIRPLA